MGGDPEMGLLPVLAGGTMEPMSRAALLPPVLLGLVILLLAQMAGLAVSALLGLPIPGVVLGLLLIVLLMLLLLQLLLVPLLVLLKQQMLLKMLLLLLLLLLQQ